MQIIVSIDGAYVRYAHRLSEAAERWPQIAREGLREGGDLTRTKVRRSLRAQMNTKSQGIITQNTVGTLVAGGALEYIIRGSGKGLPIKEFPVRGGGRARRGNWQDQPRNALGQFGPLPNNEAGKVTGEPWGISHRFKRSYRLESGEFVARLPGTRRVRRLYGPSIAKEIVKGTTAAMFQASGPAAVDTAIIRRLGRLL